MKGFIFDMDGTLLRTNELWARLPGLLIERDGIACPPALKARLGNERCSVVTKALIDAGVLPYTDEQAWAVYLDMLRDLYRQEAEWREGAEAFMRLLQRAGVPCCVATASPREAAMIALERCGAAPYFQFIQSTRDAPWGKGDPRFFGAVARRLEVPVSDCVVVEDALYAVRGAKQAGATAWAIADPLMAPDWPEIVALADESFETYADMAAAFRRKQ